MVTYCYLWLAIVKHCYLLLPIVSYCYLTAARLLPDCCQRDHSRNPRFWADLKGTFPRSASGASLRSAGSAPAEVRWRSAGKADPPARGGAILAATGCARGAIPETFT